MFDLLLFCLRFVVYLLLFRCEIVVDLLMVCFLICGCIVDLLCFCCCSCCFCCFLLLFRNLWDLFVVGLVLTYKS